MIGMTSTTWSRSVRGALAVLLAVPEIAAALSGSGALVGKSKLMVRGCGRDRAQFAATFVVAEGGTWSAQVSGAELYGGTYVPLGSSGRKIGLTLGDASSAAFVTVAGEDIATLCDAGQVTVTSVQPKAVTLALNRKLTKAKLVFRYRLEGTANGRSGHATYKLLAHGPWTPA